MFLVVCQISINGSGKVSSLQLAGQDTSLTNMCYEATCWLDSVASEVFKIKVRFNFGLFFFLQFFFFYECDFIALLMCCLGFSFLLLKKRVSYVLPGGKRNYH